MASAIVTQEEEADHLMTGNGIPSEYSWKGLAGTLTANFCWMDRVIEDMQQVHVTTEDAFDLAKWRKTSKQMDPACTWDNHQVKEELSEIKQIHYSIQNTTQQQDGTTQLRTLGAILTNLPALG